MMRHLAFTLAVLLAVSPAVAATVQQDFDAAQALLDSGKTAEARDGFKALLGRFAPSSRSVSASLVRARLGNALLGLGEPEAAEPLLATAIGGFTATDARTQEERGIALFDLGRALESQGRIDSAARAYTGVRDARVFPVDGLGDLGLRVALARSLVWSNPGEARQLLDALLAVPADKFGKSTDTIALLKTLRGRVELNLGNHAEARRWFTDAAKSAGGATTTSVSSADVRIRGDLALANFKLGRMDEVQRFVALSGAGQLLSEGLATASEMPLPACAPLTGIAPDAVAVVEFSITGDGRTTAVTPIYATRGSGSASNEADSGPEALFTQAVRNWSWAPERIAKLDPFWRQAIRVELRCFTTRSGGNAVSTAFAREFADWEASLELEPRPTFPGPDPVTLPLIRAEIARREAKYGPRSPQLLGAIRDLADNKAAPEADRAAARVRFVALATAVGARPDMIVMARLVDVPIAASEAKNDAEFNRQVRDGYVALLAEQEAAGTGDTRAAMATRLQIAETHDEMKAVAASRALLDRIVAAPESLLPANDPIRIATLLRISNQAAAARDTATAATALAATGLSPEQCALVDVRPQAINKTITEKAFPSLAIGWHTGGFARVGYDITADGATTNVRTITASPPFIFGPGTEKAIAKFRYQPVLRPDNSIGCSGSEFLQRFRVIG